MSKRNMTSTPDHGKHSGGRARGSGQLRHLRDGLEARVRLGAKVRRGFKLNPALSDEEAEKRCAVLGEIAQRLRHAGKAQTDDAIELLKAAAEAADAHELAGVLTVVDEECAGLLVDNAPRLVPTFGDLADDWTSGRLAERQP
jgi:hypothetical protein